MEENGEFGLLRWRRSNWKNEEQWRGFRDGPLCSFCKEMDDEENGHSFLITRLSRSIVRLPKNQFMHGWTTVIFSRHACELFELSDEELAGYWRDIAQVAKALYTLYNPAKINYCIFGNHIPHIHCHLVLRRFVDDPSKPVKMDENELFLEREQYAVMIRQIQDALET